MKIEAIFWLSFMFLFYVYFGYPLLLSFFRPFLRRPLFKGHEPTVTVIVAARNEAQRMERRIRNLLESDYPKEKLQIIVSLDGPTDGTESIVQQFADVELVCSSGELGKAAAINAAMPRATGDIVVFADARQTFDPKAIR